MRLRYSPETVSCAPPGRSAATAVVGLGLARGFTTTRDQLIDALGHSWPRQLLARSLNATAWGAAAVATYNAGVGYVGRANAKLEPGYSRPPTHPALSGSADSVAPFEDLGQQGRRFVTDVVTPELITSVLDEPAVAHPIRVFVGFDSEPLYQTGRAELALEELERTGAYDRRYLLLVSPTGTGWVDQTMIESAELLARFADQIDHLSVSFPKLGDQEVVAMEQILSVRSLKGWTQPQHVRCTPVFQV